MKFLVKMFGGSHMYGTNTPASDKDILGVFLPDAENLYLCNAPKHIVSKTSEDSVKNAKEDVDTTYYSLQYFLQLAFQGQTVALEMLSVKKENLLLCTPEWEYLMAHRKDFFTKKMKAFLGYCKSQAQIYSRKGEKLNLLRDLKALAEADNTLQVLDEFIEKTDKLSALTAKYKAYLLDIVPSGSVILSVCGRKFQHNLSMKYFKDSINNMINTYGKRAKEAANNNIDFKAVSHAFRILQECREILETGDLRLPLKEKDFIMKVKLGEVEAGYCLDYLEEQYQQVEQLLSVSALPETIDRKPWDLFVIEVYKALVSGDKINFYRL